MYRLLPGVVALCLLALAATACAPAAPPSPTAPPKPAATAPPATQPAATAAPAAKPAPTAAPTARPAASPAPKPAFDEKAVADFYAGRTIRILVGSAAGGGYDIFARAAARGMPRYIPGSPNVIAENRPPNNVTANLVYRSEPKDGTAIAHFAESLIMQQLLGADGIEFDAAKYNWLGAGVQEVIACVARTETGIKTIADTIGGKELIVGTNGPGSNIHDIPALLKAILGANLKIVPGYRGGFNDLHLAIERKEVDGYCAALDVISSRARDMLEGPNPTIRFIVVTGSTTPNQPLLQGVPAAEALARTDEAKLLLRTYGAPMAMGKPFAVAPEVPKDRVEALRKAMAATFADQQVLAELEKAGQTVKFTPGEGVARRVQEVMSTPPGPLAKLKEILK
ncbi:MAG: hypothetical protein HY690_11145 [Chloroflexi bacterium]|nr:hypothetical protein [Chloroflexota bacterium]